MLHAAAIEVRANGLQRIRFGSRFVLSIALHTRETQRKTGRIARRFLDVTECNLDDHLRAHIDGPLITMVLEREQLLGLPYQHVVRESLEGLAEHHKLPALGIAGPEVQVG